MTSHPPITLHQLAERRRAFMQACEPIVRCKLDIANRSMPTILVYSDGRVEYEHSVEVQKQFAACDAMVEQVASYFRNLP
jgi:hypothetical protein